MVFCFVKDEDKVNRSGLAQEWHGWPRPKSEIIEAVMFRSLRQRRGSKGFCQSAHFWPWRPWPPPGDPAILCTHTSHQISQMHHRVAGILLKSAFRMETYRMRSATWGSKHENDEVNGEFSPVLGMSSLAGWLPQSPSHSVTFALCSRQRAFRIFRKHVEG